MPDYPIEDDRETQDYDRCPEHHTDVYTFTESPADRWSIPVRAALDPATLAYVRAGWDCLTDTQRRAVAYPLLCEIIKPWHERGLVWGMFIRPVRDAGGVGLPPYRPTQVLKSEKVQVKVGGA